MKKIVFIIIYFISIQFGYTQLNYTELILNNDKKLIVQGKITKHHFKYKFHSKDNSKKIHFSEINYVKIHFSKDDIKVYKYFKIADTEKFKVLEEIEKGKVALYTTTSNGYVDPFAAGINRMAYTIENYYVKKQDDNQVMHLGSNQLFTINFIEGASTFFNDCEELVNRIKNKEFKKRDIVDIVKFYNKYCN